MTDQIKAARKKNFKISLTIFLVRSWAAGAVYFFIGWGTGLGQRSSALDLVFFLALSIGIFNALVIHPSLKMLFDVGWHKPYAQSTFGERMANRGKDISFSLLIVICITLFYQGVNIAAIYFLALPEDAVFLPGEPFLFALLYGMFAQFFLGIISLIKKKDASDS